ncbi:MAG: helix-turn-helix transcriptional regulator [Abditibacteriota bacterium]|nr:helix-turn-helix transcriptional regulator [Abditibacteriota bacterium]
MSDLNKIFASNLKKYRKQYKISQAELSSKTGLNRAYISQIECNKRNISIKNLEKIAKALNIDAYLLIK